MSGQPVIEYCATEAVDLVALLDVVLLGLPEQAGHEAEAVLAGRGEAQLVAVLLVAVLALDVLGRVDQVVVGRRTRCSTYSVSYQKP